MKRWNRFFVAVIVSLCLVGCELPGDDMDDMELTQEDMNTVQTSLAPVHTEDSASGIETLSIYTVDPAGQQLMPVKVRINRERVTPEYILDEVVQNLDEKVIITEIEVEHSRIYVTFDHKYAPISNCSKTFETLILDCISNSLLDNISYIDEVVFRCEEGAYHSVNYSFGKEEVYSSK